MNAKELAGKLGVHYNTIYKKIKSGEISAKKIGKSYEVEDYIAQKLILDKMQDRIYENMDRYVKLIIGFLNEKKIKEFEMLIESMDSFSNDFKEDSKHFENEITIDEEKMALKINVSKRNYINQEIENQEGGYNQIQLRYEFIEKIQNAIDVLNFYRQEMSQRKED